MAVLVIVLALVFFFANVPEIKTKDEYHIDDPDAGTDVAMMAERQINRRLVYFLLLTNASVLVGVVVMILWVILTTAGVGDCRDCKDLVALSAAPLLPLPPWRSSQSSRKISHHSIWSHPHFSGATLAQFFYVAAQAGIFSFLINYMTSEVPAHPRASPGLGGSSGL